MNHMEFFKPQKIVIGMVHVQALPGAPSHKLAMSEIISQAVEEAILYQKAGIDVIMLENMHDIPYLKRAVGPETTSAMAVVAQSVRQAVDLPLGIQILAGANREALAVAKAVGLDFIRVEGYVFGHVADEGYIDSCAGDLLRYRRMIGAEEVMVFTDIKKKHSSHSITADIEIEETARAAEFFLSDGIILTGSATGEAVCINELRCLKDRIKLPVIIGSGVTGNNLEEYWEYASAFIVGSYFKEGGYWKNPVDNQRVEYFMNQVRKMRSVFD